MGQLFVLAVDQPSSTNGLSTIHWVLLIDPRKPSRIMSLNVKPYAFDLCEGSSRLLTNPDGLRPHSLLKFHIADMKQSSLPQIKARLSQIAGLSSEGWLLSALAALQDAGPVERFSAIKFLEFANDAVSTHRRSYHKNTEEIDYIALLQSNQHVKQMLQRHQDPEPESENKKSFLGFWTTRPGSSCEQDRHAEGFVRRRDDPYGGLM